jgi:hypothetical protein
MKTSLVLSSLIFTSWLAVAEEIPVLQSVVAAQSTALDQPGPGILNCATGKQQLQVYLNNLRQVAVSVVNVVDDASSVMHSWHSQLSPYEGQTVKIPYGMFDNILNSAQTEAQNATAFRSYFSQLDSDLVRIMALVGQCQ